ncbi:MAG: plasmid pRiA4b ORF-3 family protein [Candidatus Adiutrix sp.]|jgi:hypothetical protein|nr:plasmid pRiA4b ORF-3 family protein [Candidatus Adiutrix sp.]
MSTPIYLFKIELDDIKPKIWREFFVPADLTLADFHQVIQQVMGWHNAHMHEFEINGERYHEKPDPEIPARRTRAYRLMNLVPDQTKVIHYTYDFGDSWEHSIKLVKAAFTPPEGFANGYGCLRGARACPPEDIGGPYVYPDFLAALNDPDNPEHSEMKEWYADFFDADEPFDSERFDLQEVNKVLARIKAKKSRKKTEADI